MCSDGDTSATWKLSTIYCTQLKEEEVQINNTYSRQTPSAPIGERDPDTRICDTGPAHVLLHLLTEHQACWGVRFHNYYFNSPGKSAAWMSKPASSSLPSPWRASGHSLPI